MLSDSRPHNVGGGGRQLVNDVEWNIILFTELQYESLASQVLYTGLASQSPLQCWVHLGTDLRGHSPLQCWGEGRPNGLNIVRASVNQVQDPATENSGSNIVRANVNPFQDPATECPDTKCPGCNK